jgi:Protein of unknown function (DUF2726)
MSTLQIALAAAVIVFLMAWLWLRQRKDDNRGAENTTDRVDTVTGWPPQVTRVLSTHERIAFGTLVRAMPEYMVLAQVPLARFINVPKRNSYADWLRRVGYQCVDFVVCDMTAQVIAVIELTPPQAQSERARKRLTRITRTLKAARVPLHVWRENALPAVDAAREVLLPRVPEPAPGALTPALTIGAAGAAAAGIAMASPAPDKGFSPFEDTDRDSTQDERIELLEPPPSTWFDDLDSDPVPLSKR